MTEQLHYRNDGPPIDARHVEDFATSALAQVGVPIDDAKFVGKTLIHADLRGVHSHGVRLLTNYIHEIQAGTANPTPKVRTTNDSQGAAVFEGDRSLGQIGARAGIQAAMNLATERGIGVASVANTGHFGAAAYWALLAANAGFIGFATSNMAGPINLAYGSKEPATGNTPLAWAFPSGNPYPVVLDMACGAYAIGKIRLAAAADQPLPDNVAADADGQPTNNAADAAYVLPAGGPKGYGIGLIHDLIAGCLTGDGATIMKGAYDPPTSGPKGSLFFMTIDVNAFLPIADFRQAMDLQTHAVNQLPPADGFTQVHMPGQPEWELFETRKHTGISYPPGVLDNLDSLADDLGLEFPTTK